MIITGAITITGDILTALTGSSHLIHRHQTAFTIDSQFRKGIIRTLHLKVAGYDCSLLFLN